MKLLFDFLPIVLFFIAYQVTADLYLAIIVIMVATTLQVGWMWLRYRKVERMLLVSAGLLMLFGGISLVFQDEIFIKWKPTVLNWLFAVVFLATQFIGRKTLVERMMASALELPKLVWTRLNLGWVVFFLVMGGINIYVAYSFDTNTWVNFKLYGMLGLTLIFVLAQGVYLARYMPESKPE